MATAADSAGRELHFDRFFENVGAVVCGVHTVEWARREPAKNGQAFVWPFQQPTWVVTQRDLELVYGVA